MLRWHALAAPSPPEKLNAVSVVDVAERRGGLRLCMGYEPLILNTPQKRVTDVGKMERYTEQLLLLP